MLNERLDDLPLVLTVDEVAKLLRFSRSKTYDAIRHGEIPHVRLGREIRIPRHALLKLLGITDPAKVEQDEDARSEETNVVDLHR